jgi:hypothetical protein
MWLPCCCCCCCQAAAQAAADAAAGASSAELEKVNKELAALKSSHNTLRENFKKNLEAARRIKKENDALKPANEKLQVRQSPNYICVSCVAVLCMCIASLSSLVAEETRAGLRGCLGASPAPPVTHFDRPQRLCVLNNCGGCCVYVGLQKQPEHVQGAAWERLRHYLTPLPCLCVC